MIYAFLMIIIVLLFSILGTIWTVSLEWKQWRDERFKPTNNKETN